MNILKQFRKGRKCDEKADVHGPSQRASLAFSRRSSKTFLKRTMKSKENSRKRQVGVVQAHGFPTKKVDKHHK